jgi:hypothetical protein
MIGDCFRVLVADGIFDPLLGSYKGHLQKFSGLLLLTSQVVLFRVLISPAVAH